MATPLPQEWSRGALERAVPKVQERIVARSELWPIFVGLGCATVMQISLLWDFSWHTTIGRDTFWTPAHIGLYAGGGIPGLVYGALVLHTTWFGSPAARGRSVRFWGFRAPLGAWVAIWGSIAMLTAAPFDQWWHFSYGIDVRIISPPHILLLVGVTATHVGVLLLAAAATNRSSGREAKTAASLKCYGAGMLLLMAGLFGMEATYPTYMHGPMFYLFVAASFPIWLVATGGAGLAWPATTAALSYTALRLFMTWVLPLFPAIPRIGPIHFYPTHMVPPGFPLLLIAPALALDLIARRSETVDVRLRSLLLGCTFFVAFLAVQWPFANFLMSPWARNWVFAADNFRFDLLPNSFTAHYRFLPWRDPRVPTWLAILAAAPVAVASAQLGLWLRAFLGRIQR
ncbi:MAG: hypothetical protein ABI647_02435 [Gemmatimonadota bacterium]